MRAAEIARELAYPVTNPTVAAALIFFYLLVRLVVSIVSAGLYALVSALIIASFAGPALFLYLVDLLEARARGRDPEPPSVEHLHWFGSSWSLAQMLHLATVIYATYILDSTFGWPGVLVGLGVIAVALPASLAILALTHSPVESLNPMATLRLVRRCAGRYWIAPAWFVAGGACVAWLSTRSLPGWLTEFVVLYLLFAFYALVGAVVRPYRLHDEVDIHIPIDPDPGRVDAQVVAMRTSVLDHAYGFFSRDNRAGGLKHIEDWIENDPQPEVARAWFFQQMLRWEMKQPALAFGQRYLGRLLREDDPVGALKVILRCRLEDDNFLPLPADRPLALEAAESCQHDELASLLR